MRIKSYLSTSMAYKKEPSQRSEILTLKNKLNLCGTWDIHLSMKKYFQRKFNLNELESTLLP